MLADKQVEQVEDLDDPPQPHAVDQLVDSHGVKWGFGRREDKDLAPDDVVE
jgi:hypothetical protein